MTILAIDTSNYTLGIAASRRHHHSRTHYIFEKEPLCKSDACCSFIAE